MFEFKARVVDRSDDGYYVTRWDLAKPITVLAETQKEAYEKIWAVKGEAPWHRHWTAVIDSIKEVPDTPASSSLIDQRIGDANVIINTLDVTLEQREAAQIFLEEAERYFDNTLSVEEWKAVINAFIAHGWRPSE